MRRRRQKLQVTTFPFLAVLLCTLGVLIMLLLILDQRSRLLAKQQAEHEAAEARQAVQLQRQEDADRRTTEMRKHLEALHGERAAVQGDVVGSRRRQTDAAARLEAKRRELAVLEGWLHSEEEQTARKVEMQQTRQEEVQRLAGKRSAAEAERDRVRHQLAVMEQAVEQLHEAARRRPPMYALAPYRGKKGTQRQPVYLECVGDRLIFQPGGRSLSLADLGTGDALQGEIEARFHEATSRETGQKPYALLMIRPSGISLYYAILRVLRKFEIDLGYEFIDEEWVLDFKPPSDTATCVVTPTAPLHVSAERPVPVTLGGPDRSTGGSAGALASPGNSSNQGPSRVGEAVQEGEVPAEPSNLGLPARPPIVSPTVQRPSGPSGGLSPEVTGLKPTLVGAGPATESALGGQATNRSAAARDGGAETADKGTGRAAAGAESRVRPTEVRASPQATGRPGYGAAGEGARTQAPQTPAGPAEAERRSRVSGKPGTGKGGSEAERDPDSEEDAPRQPKPVRVDSSEVADQRPAGERPNPVGLSAARTWLIVVECSAEHVILEGREPLKLDAARWDRDGPVLLRTLQERVEQKKVRFPEQRPQLKFQIHADGLRTYYQAAGTLQPLNLPVTWELLPAEPKGGPSQR